MERSLSLIACRTLMVTLAPLRVLVGTYKDSNGFSPTSLIPAQRHSVMSCNGVVTLRPLLMCRSVITVFIT